jgi:hypothetical protein
MQKLSDRISTIIENEHISTRSFEVRIGASNGLISKCILKGTDINSIWLSKIIEEFPMYNPGWLLTGIGEMIIDEPASLPTNAPCPRCKEKDERITELKDHISTLKGKISSLEKASVASNSNYSQTA